MTSWRLPEVSQALVSLQDVVLAAERLLQRADAQVTPLGTKLAGAADAGPRCPGGRPEAAAQR